MKLKAKYKSVKIGYTEYVGDVPDVIADKAIKRNPSVANYFESRAVIVPKTIEKSTIEKKEIKENKHGKAQ